MVNLFQYQLKKESSITRIIINWFVFIYIILVIIHMVLVTLVENRVIFFIADLTAVSVFLIMGYMNKKNVSNNIRTWTFAILSQPIIFFYYVILNGSAGPHGIMVLTNIFMILTFDEQKRYKQFFLLNATSALCCIVFEYFYPALIYPFLSKEFEIFNFIFIIFSVGICVAITIYYVQINYLKEKEIVLEKNTLLKSTKLKIEFRTRYLNSLKELQSKFLLEQDLTTAYESILKDIIEGTGSAFGCIGKINDETSKFNLLTVEHEKWDAKFKKLYINHDIDWLKMNGLFDLVQTCNQQKEIKQSFFTQKNTLNQVSKLYYLYLPIVRLNDFLGFVLIFNSHSPFDDTALELIKPFDAIFYTILQNEKLNEQQKENEKQLLLSKEDADQNLQQKSQFLTNISHELRTPLSLIIGPVTTLIGDKKALSNLQKVKNSLSLSLDNSNKIRLFINDISNLSNLSANNIKIEPSTYNFYTFIHQIYSSFKVQTMYRDISFQLEYNAEKSIDLYFDIRKVENILSNLLTNAFKFTPNKGLIKIIIQEEAEHLLVVVQDSGIGIKDTDIDHIFDRFFQTKDKEKNIFSGTGVGLALSQELAQLMGFTIKVESTYKEGATFYFRLLKHISEQTVEPTKSFALDGNHVFEETILVVEDNYSMNKFIVDLFSDAFNVFSAMNGLEALQILNSKQQSIDVVITDLMMPEMDGISLIEKMKSSENIQNVPILVLTAMNSSQMKIDLFRTGVSEFMSKPFSATELKIKIKKILNDAHVKKMLNIESEVAVSEQNQISQKADDWARAIKIVVNQHLDNPDFSVEDVATSLNVSKRNLYRYVQDNFDKTPLNLIKDIKLDAAKKMLEIGSSKSLKEVVFATGFNTVRHFKKIYKAKFDQDPSMYFKD